MSSFATNLNAQFWRLTAMYPQLLGAVPPEPIEQRDGRFYFNIAEFWPEFCAHEWQPRPGNDANLVGPFNMYGECLDPYIRPGEIHYYDPTLPARDGDVVLVQWAPDVLEGMYQRNGSSPEWLKQYGAPCPIATKIYKTLGSSQYLLTRKSAIPLGQNRILGVLRKRVVDGVDVSAPCVSLIEQYAATRVYTADQAAETFYATGSSQIALQLVITPDHAGELQVTSFHDARYVPSGGITSIAGLCVTNLALSSLGSPLATGGIQSYYETYSNHAQPLSYSVTAGTPYYLQLIVGSASTGMYLRATKLRAELIKR